jgi:ABC-type Zn uptake system ZnuABC Zn-binding protein ZnuA
MMVMKRLLSLLFVVMLAACNTTMTEGEKLMNENVAENDIVQLVVIKAGKDEKIFKDEESIKSIMKIFEEAKVYEADLQLANVEYTVTSKKKKRKRGEL